MGAEPGRVPAGTAGGVATTVNGAAGGIPPLPAEPQVARLEGMPPLEKARLFHDLALMLRSGLPFSKAVASLQQRARGHTAAVLKVASERLAAGECVAESLAAASGRIGALELGILKAAEKSGTLVAGFEQCAAYYAAIGAARTRILSNLRYPLFILHVGIVCAAIPRAFAAEGSFATVVFAILPTLLGLWLLIGAALGLFRLLLDRAQNSLPLELLLSRVPGLGALRRDFALSRFCAAYAMGIEAGMSVYPSLEAAAQAGGNAALSAAVAQASRIVSEGGSVADGIAPGGFFPEAVVHAFYVGEQTGSTVSEVRRQAEQTQQSALARLDVMSEWIPRLVYLGACIYIGALAVRGIRGYYQPINDLLKGG